MRGRLFGDASRLLGGHEQPDRDLVHPRLLQMAERGIRAATAAD